MFGPQKAQYKSGSTTYMKPVDSGIKLQNQIRYLQPVLKIRYTHRQKDDTIFPCENMLQSFKRQAWLLYTEHNYKRNGFCPHSS